MAKIKEIWKDVIGYNGKYQVSNLGRVKSITRVITSPNRSSLYKLGRILRPINHHGYKCVFLANSGNQKRNTIHRLVVSSFLPNPNGLKEVNHKNGIKGDNRLDNLEWCTRSENMLHAFKVCGRVNAGLKGDKNPAAKLTPENVRDIRRMKLSGIAAKEIAEKFNLNKGYVFAIIARDSWAWLA